MTDPQPREETHDYENDKIDEVFSAIPKLKTLMGTQNNIELNIQPPLDECSSIRETYTEWKKMGYVFIGGYTDGSTLAINLAENNLLVFFNKKSSEAMLDNKVLGQVYIDLLKGMEFGNPEHNYNKVTVGAIHCADSVVDMGGMDMLRSAPAVMRIAFNKQSIFYTFTASKQVFDQSTGLMGMALNVFNTNNPAHCIEVIRTMRRYGTETTNEQKLQFIRDINHLTLADGSPVKVSVRGVKNYEKQ